MRVEITGRKFEVGEKLQNVIRKKLAKFDKYFDDDTIATVVCKADNGGRQLMELTIRLKDSTVLRGETQSDNMYDNIDALMPKIERQIRKHKTRLEKKLREGAYVGEEEAEEDFSDVIVRSKTFTLETITPEDAVAQLDLVSNSFYVFLNDKTGKVAVVYRRKEGGFGQIDFDY